MRRGLPLPIVVALSIVVAGTVRAATVVPNEIKQPGTQPGEVSALESPAKCDNCHGGYDSAVEPAFNWRVSTQRPRLAPLATVPWWKRTTWGE